MTRPLPGPATFHTLGLPTGQPGDAARDPVESQYSSGNAVIPVFSRLGVSGRDRPAGGAGQPVFSMTSSPLPRAVGKHDCEATILQEISHTTDCRPTGSQDAA